MSNKSKTAYVCNNCGAEYHKWQGKCAACNQWNTVHEIKLAPAKSSTSTSKQQGYAGAQSQKPQALSELKDSKERIRISSGIDEFDRVLGGGFVDGEIILIGGDPGIGKSTLLIQALDKIAKKNPETTNLYISGEESSDQIALRATRLGLNLETINVFCAVELETILATLENAPSKFVIIDSIQTIYSNQIESAPGTVSQLRECAAALTHFAKKTGTIIILVGHVTKDGNIAGPRVLEHIVDAVFYFEGDQQLSHRILRGFKNRFGSVHEVGIFLMAEKGLEEVSNPSSLFLTQHAKPVSGSCIAVVAEGNRPLLVETQALVEDSHTPNPKRLCVGMDPNRLSMLLAVLHKSCGVACFDQNVYLNITTGVRINETAADLPALLAILSSIKNTPLPEKLIAFGEVGLSGEIRMTQKGLERLNEAAKLGFKKAIIPKGNLPKTNIQGLEIKAVSNIYDAIHVLKNWS